MAKKLLYIYPVNTSFIRTDGELLSKSHVIKNFLFNPKHKLYTPFIFINQFIFLLINIWKSEVIICHFAGYHSFLPALLSKWLKKPSIIILAGTDCVAFPSIKYGNFLKPLLGKFTKWSLQLCTHTCPVHKSLVFSEYTYTNDDYPNQGYKFHCRMAQSNFTEIPYGFDKNKFYSKNNPRKSNSFLTVTQSIQGASYYRKGIDLILEISKVFPDYTFMIIGKDIEFINYIIPMNVTFVPPVRFDELINYYNQFEFYLQLSICEGFPNSLCEAMLCGCIPIGSNVASIPEIIESAGFILKHKKTDELKDIIRKATQCNKTKYSMAAQARIKLNFTLERRRKALKSVIELVSL